MTDARTTPVPISAAPPTASAPAPALGQRAARGFAFMAAASIVGKVAGGGTQVALSYFLDRRDFGLLAPATAIMVFAGIVQQAGIRDVLVQRQARFKLWSNPAFWMSLALSGLGALAMVGVAAAVWLGGPAVVHALGAAKGGTDLTVADTRRIAGLIAVLSGQLVAGGILAVPEARLQIQMRFRLIATLDLTTLTAIALGSILLAWQGLGPFAIVIPPVVAYLCRAVVVWSITRCPMHPDPQMRRWRYLVKDSALLLGAAVCLTVVGQLDPLVMTAVYPKGEVGAYSYAWNLSTHTLRLLMLNVMGVLFPALAAMQAQPQRQRAAVLRAARFLLLLGVPGCFLQAALAGPAIRLLLREEYYPVIGPLQFLSLGMAVYLIAGPAFSTIRARGEFRRYFLVSAVGAAGYALVVLACAASAPAGQGARAMAVAVGAYLTLAGPLLMLVALRPLGGGWREVGEVLGVPVVAGGLAVGAATLAALGIGRLAPPAGRLQWGVQLLVIPVLSAAIYLPLWRWWAPQAWAEGWARLRAFRR